MADANGADNSGPTRPRLNLKPRDPAIAAKIEAERQQSIGTNPFGAAKPRELVIAQRVGKTEEEILLEDAKKQKLHLRLNATQLEEKRAVEATVKEVADQIAAEEDAAKKAALAVELAARQEKLDALMEQFAKATLETALSGEAPRVSALRRAQAEQALAAGPPPPPQQFGQYNSRYNPTQQYAGPAQRGGFAPRGGHDGYQVAPQRGGYAPRGGGRGYEGGYQPRGGGAGGGGGRGLPEWAREEYVQPGGGGGGGGGFGTPGGYRPAGGAAQYNDGSDAGFYDNPAGGGGGGGRGRGGRGRGRGGRGGGYDNGGGGGGGYYDAGESSGYGAPAGGGGRGVGGEIEFDSFGVGQDRY